MSRAERLEVEIAHVRSQLTEAERMAEQPVETPHTPHVWPVDAVKEEEVVLGWGGAVRREFL